MKLLACLIIGFTAGCLIGYCAFREHKTPPKMRAASELRERERMELRTDDL